MRVVPLDAIRRAVDPGRLIGIMRDAVIAQSRGKRGADAHAPRRPRAQGRDQ